MLHILTGRAGSGKTTQVLRRMREAGERRTQLLQVPEQASFETERRFCRANGNQAGRYGEAGRRSLFWTQGAGCWFYTPPFVLCRPI